jgi:signal transduction histidine kinase
MKKNSNFELIISYIKFHSKVIALFFVFSLIFGIVFFLYNLPIEAVVYGFLLCAFLGIIFIGADFYKYYNKHKLLNNLKRNIILNIDELPEAKDIIGEDYNKLISIIHKEKNKIASDADIARSDLMDYYTLWAHQIKTPIAAMRLLLQTEDNELNTELSMELFKIEQYVEFVLQYLRLESISSDLVLKQYNLDDIVKQGVRKYAKMFIRKKIKLNFNDLNCTVLTDEKWLLFVIEQILSNALKYTKEGSISIYMDKKSEETLVIEDTGIGISPEDLPRVFERGYTGYNGRSNKKSTGIGLYLCKLVLIINNLQLTFNNCRGNIKDFKGCRVLRHPYFTDY